MAKAATYTSLRSQVRRMLREGEDAGAEKRVARYYRIGEMIDFHVLGHGGKPEYGKVVMQRLADDLSVGYQRLYEMLSVRRAYPIFRTGGKLSWAHYVTLSTIDDERLREAYEAHAVRGRWSRQTLRDRIREGRLAAESGDLLAEWNASVPPNPRRGIPYTYRVKEIVEGGLLVDLGMGVELGVDVDVPESIAQGDVVRTRRNGRIYEVEPGERGNLYTFRASVTRVVDGDTFWAKVDYGFRFSQPWKVRLRGVDAPELGTEEGEQAKAWVEERLARLPFVVMTTTKVGMYGRYIADVFFGDSKKVDNVARRGKYLNGEMVEAGVAGRA
jgi:hypothetical protein